MEQAKLAKELEEAKANVLAISEDAFDASGNLIKYQETIPGQEYLKIQEKQETLPTKMRWKLPSIIIYTLSLTAIGKMVISYLSVVILKTSATQFHVYPAKRSCFIGLTMTNTMLKQENTLQIIPKIY